MFFKSFSGLMFACMVSLLTDMNQSSANEIDGEQTQMKTEALREEGPEAPVEYIIAFRDLLGDRNHHYLDYQRRTQHHASALGALPNYLSVTTAAQYLGSLNLTSLGDSFNKPVRWSQPTLFFNKLEATEQFASLVTVSFSSEASAQIALAQWQRQGNIWFAERNGRSYLKSEREDEIINKFENNQQNTPWLEEISYISAIKKMATVSEVAEPVIAVMDSGVDVFHRHLQAAIYQNETGQNKLCKNDIYGCNTTKAKKDVLGDGNVYPTGTDDFGQSCMGNDECEHGTHVAGIIAARDADNYVGLCPYCKLLVVKVVEVENQNGKSKFAIKDSSIIAGLAYISGFKVAGEPLVRVINASFGKFEKSRSVELFIEALKKFGRGTLMVAAAGNEDTMKRQYPAAFDSVMAVSNVMSDINNPSKSESSNFGSWVDISAPGDGSCQGLGSSRGILSSVPGGDSDCKVGTSMASPVVAGIAGLVLASEPNLTASQLEARLLQTASVAELYQDSSNAPYRPTISGVGAIPLLGSGIINAYAALDPSQVTALPLSTARSDLVGTGCGQLGGSVQTSSASWLLLLGPLVLMIFHQLYLTIRRDRWRRP